MGATNLFLIKDNFSLISSIYILRHSHTESILVIPLREKLEEAKNEFPQGIL